MSEVFRTELHSFPLKAILDEAVEALGSARVNEILAQHGVAAEELRDTNAWVSLRFVENLLEALSAASAGTPFLERAMKRGLSARYLGPIFPLMFALGSPLLAYKQLERAAGRFNKTGRWEAHDLRVGHVDLSWCPFPGSPEERSPLICRTRVLQLERFPAIFGHLPAKIQHAECLLRGAERCRYVATWAEPAPRPYASLGFWGGLAIAVPAMLIADAPAAIGAMVIAGLGAGGWAVGRVHALQGLLTARVADVDEHNQALERMNQINDQRFADLLEAKSQVERRVDERTAELQDATRRLSETLEEIQALDRAKTDFFNNVSHELRSPLTMIVAPLEDLAEGRTPAGGTQVAFEAMRHNARRLLQLINQLLDLAKIDAGEMKIAPTLTDMPALVRRALEGFEAAMQRKNITLNVAVPREMAPVAIDVSWIESALTNLVANALRLTPEGRQIGVSVEDHGSEVSISVADEGPGIAPEDQSKVFARFAQGDVSKRVVGGTGIGLALVREAARLHGGKVTLASELGHGATFTLVLPRRAIATRSGATSTPPTTERAHVVFDDVATTGSSDRPGPSPLAPLAIVVEDNPELRNFISDVLSARFRVRSAADGRDGLALATELAPEVIVSDIAMPEMDGLTLCRTLREHPKTRAVPVVLVTARTEVASILEGFDAGANDYILKPFHGRELLARIDVHVRVRRLAEQLALRERHAMLGITAAAVAHQVRNPLTALVGGLPAMRSRIKDRIDDRTLELIDVMIDCATRIERMTHDLMDLSRVDRETSGPYRPSDGLRSALRLTRARASATEVSFDERIEDCPVIQGRAGDMNHVFMNLLDNAVRAANSHGKVAVHATVLADGYRVDIGDSGSGIDPQHAGQIFEPFYTTRAAGEGTGLGLAVARQVVQQCGGRIELGRSELGGALFTVHIPLIPTDGEGAHLSAYNLPAA